VRKDNDKSRDMKAHDIVRAIRNLEAAGIPIPDELHILQPLALTRTIAATSAWRNNSDTAHTAPTFPRLR